MFQCSWILTEAETIYQVMPCSGTGSCLWWDTGEAMKKEGKLKRCTEEELPIFFLEFHAFRDQILQGKKLLKNRKKTTKKTPNKPKKYPPKKPQENPQEVNKICLPLPTSVSTCSPVVSIDTQQPAQAGTHGQGDITK